MTVTITGTNDVASVSSDSKSVTEGDIAAALNASGQLTIVDPDSGEAHVVAQSNVHGSYGDFSIDASGAWSYAGNGAHDELTAGQQVQDQFTVTSQDGTATGTVTVTITGTNDAATVSSEAKSVTEGDTATALNTSGQLTIVDPDSGEAQVVAQSNAHGSYGDFSIDANGAWSYAGNGAHDELTAGQQVQDQFTVTSQDGTATGTVTVTITGTNDAPTLAAVTGPTYTDTAANDTFSPATGTLTGHDVDTTDTLTYGITGGTTGSTTIGGITYDVSKAGSFGTLFVKSATGQYIYQENDAAINAAKTATGESFAVTTSDGTASASQTFTVTVNGTPDSPTFLHIGDGGASGGQDHVVSSQSGDAVVSGTAEAGDTISIYTAAIGGALLGTATADGSGNWSYTLTSSNIVTLGQGTGKLAYADSTFGAVTSSPRASSFAFSIDTVAPTVSTEAIASATGIQNNTLNAGDVVSVAATFGEVVNVSGTPQLALNIGGTTVQANYASGSGSNQLVFTYTIQAGQTDTNGISINANAITLNGGSISDPAGNTASPTAATVADNANFKVDTNAPTVTSVVLSDSKVTDADAGNTVNATIAFSEVMDQTSTPVVSNNAAGTLINATNGHWTSSTTYQVSYIEADANVTASDITFNVSGAKDLAGNTQVPTTNVSSGTSIDTQNPTLITVALQTPSTSPTNANSLVFRVTFSEAATNVDTADFTVSGTTATATNVSLVSAGVYDVTVSGGNLANLNGTVGLALKSTGGGATVNDLAGNALTNFATTGGSATYMVDNTAPSITITESPSLPNTVGATTTLTFQFSETVTGFTASDVSTTRGTLSNFTVVDGDTYTATFTRTATGAANVSVSAGSYTDDAGNAGSSGSSGNLPAGISGQPINLGLVDASEALTTVTVSGVPTGWSINGATVDLDGSWTLLTNQVSSLTVTTTPLFVGALVLKVTENWTNADGSTGSATLVDNVEAYAPGSPIFAWSGDDTLTGSAGHDTFVLSQPIGNDVVHSFDVSSDVIDLISYGWQSFGDVQAHAADDANGNAVITLAAGQAITLDGVHAADLTAANFEFDVTPTVHNPGAMTIGDGAMLPLSGIIDNTGTIELQASGDDTLLQLIQTGVKLEGGGHVILSDDDHNIIAGTAPDVTLDNIDNTISGAGQLGQGNLSLSNAATILADGVHALVIDTGQNVIVNAGTLEATGAGGLQINSAIINTGLLWANGGAVTALGEVSGSGSAEISGIGTIEFGAASSANVTIDANATGHLVLDDAFHFTGTVSGLTADDDVDLKGVNFSGESTLSFTENQAGTGGTLTVSDGAHTANIVLLGQYDPAGFTAKSDTASHTVIAYDPHHIA
ncbi:VCBS domain-containing protein [Bradyrhizobium sp. 197]|uniref:beta strand repeat-containing protein n=1 Tax=Bradyrhizobium sp. 197 TaxID=2782663 RepID=UPI0031F6A7E8